MVFLFGYVENVEEKVVEIYSPKSNTIRIALTSIAHQQNEKKGRKQRWRWEKIEKVELLNMNEQMKTNYIKVFRNQGGTRTVGNWVNSQQK